MTVLRRPVELKDAHWTRQAFFAPKRYGGASQQISNSFTSADMKWTDTTPGGNKSINPPSQFTRYADIKRPSLSATSKGQGGYYSRAIDDNSQRVSFRFGVPRYNSLSRFLSGYYDFQAGMLVNTGKADGLLSPYTIGKALGTLYTLPLQAYFGLTYLVTRITSAITGRPYSKFYYLEPTMPLYWSTVNTLTNQLAVNMGLVHGYAAADLEGDEGKAQPKKGLSSADIRRLNQLLPDVIRNDSYSVIDVKAISSRSQRLSNKYHETMHKIATEEGLDHEGFRKKVREALRRNSMTDETTQFNDLQEYMNNFVNSPTGRGVGATDINPTEEGQLQVDLSKETVRTDEPGLMDFLHAELREGSAFVTFTVDNEGSTGESFSSSTKETGLAETLNNTARAGLDNYVNFAGGNIGDGIISSAVEAAYTGVRELMAGVASSVGLGGLASLGGAAFVDIQDVWEASTAELPSSTYRFRLSTPYGNPMSVFLKIYMPLMCLLAGALPRSTGKSSYSSPFLCSVHSQGRNDIKLGIIDSLTIERGTSNIGFARGGLPTAVDVTISVKNLNTIMHMPVSDSLLKTLTSFSFFDEDTALSDYLATLSSMDLYDQFYMAPRMNLAFAKTAATWDSFTSPSYFAQLAADTAPGQLISAIMASSENLRGI